MRAPRVILSEAKEPCPSSWLLRFAQDDTGAQDDSGAAAGSAARGYTLVEIVVVLAIVAVVTAIVLPSMLQHPASAALQSADDVAGIVRAARRAALEQAVPVIVTLAPATRAYLVETDAGDSSAVLAQGVLALAPGARLAAGGPATRIVFDRLGTASPDSVTVIDDDGSVMVSVDRWTGEVNVRPGAR